MIHKHALPMNYLTSITLGLSEEMGEHFKVSEAFNGVHYLMLRDKDRNGSVLVVHRLRMHHSIALRLNMGPLFYP
jgi:hypothetical protein